MKKLFYFFAIAALALGMASCEGNDPTQTVPGALKGKFSVAANKQVYFSQGNLQYRASTDVWRFAENQWDVVGNNTLGTVYEGLTKSCNTKIASNYDGWIDLFGWGTAKEPTKTSEYTSDYPEYFEWGNKPIANGGNKANEWRTLTSDEWKYLFYGRTDAAHLFGMGSVNGVNGTILLPDNWSGDKFTDTDNGLVDRGTYYENSNSTNFSFHTFTAEQWKTMEEAGAVFLPAAGYRYGTDVSLVGSYGYYWSSTPYQEDNVAIMYFNSRSLIPQNDSSKRYFGLPVRLVQDVK